ncbi:DUF3987 domain-containing protein [Flammeovirga kamogawensis]|uniref:DUF3987 domain-containing protein n=1 Tax=Flammeovirga kamogawensis TaxID=373891 RepID=A0ABX8GTW9_9BACT|nr:DUF3987 domain-containing protein [Flammeovirga kamogawensis]MBB6463341.1 hypothetical protein [Flammeovirga kamogawensis]QWG06687.1 DUF3987 domain-containing protein [Flammeovirga kamogawensis]TRX68509.1 DUF3987 domain-containing protein [Flammeovirga kamogawensis]
MVKVPKKVDLNNISSLEDTVLPVNTVREDVKYPFPLHVFPKYIQDLLLELQAVFSFEISYTAMTLLVVLSVIVGKYFKITVKKGWTTIPSIYTAIIGNSSIGKSPAINIILKVLTSINDKEIERYEVKKAEWNDAIAGMSEAEKKDYKAENEEPTRKRLITSDATQESLCYLLAKDAMVLYKDELIGWIKSMNQYRQGADTEFFLSLFNGQVGEVDRVGKNLFVKDPFLSIIGGIQPSILPLLTKNGNSANGFLFRILFIMPENESVHYLSDKELSSNCLETFYQKMESLYDMLQGEEIRNIPLIKEAMLYFIHSVNHYIKVASETKDENIISAYKKVGNYMPRFALLLEVLDQLYGDDLGVCIENISLASMEKAKLLCDYFIETATYILEQTNDKSSLQTNHQKFLDTIPDNQVITTSELNKLAESIGIKTSNFKNRVLPKLLEKGMLQKTEKRGEYIKNKT